MGEAANLASEDNLYLTARLARSSLTALHHKWHELQQ
jgi:hypothetical protein